MKNLLTIRTDNGPQFVSKFFGDTCKAIGLNHQRILIKTPNMNAHIESFNAILERDCYNRNKFMSYLDVYETVSNYMDYTNNRYPHGSLDDMSPSNFYNAILNNGFEPKEFIA